MPKFDINNDKLFAYTTQLMLRFFKKRSINKGERFFVLFQKADEVNGQYEALRRNVDFGVKDWAWPEAEYHSFSVNIDGTEIIIAAASDDVKEDFLTGLRNKIDSDAIQFKNHAILFLLYKPLDSLINGSDDLSKGGMPLHLDEISKSISNDINDSSKLEAYERKILNFSLTRKTDNYFIKRRSLFDLEIFLSVLGNGKIEKEQYAALGLFPDINLKNVSASDTVNTNKRLTKNAEWFENILNGHKYNHVESYLDKNFSEKGVESLKDPDRWSIYAYETLVKWADEKAQKQGVEYNETLLCQTSEGLLFWDKADGETSVKFRRRNIMIFNPGHLDFCSLKLDFDGKVYREGLQPNKTIPSDQLSSSGKSINATVRLQNPLNVEFKYFGYNDPNSNHKFSFEIAIFPFSENWLLGIKTCYQIDHSHKMILVSPEGNIYINGNSRGQKTLPLDYDKQYILEEDCALELLTDEIDPPNNETHIPFSLKLADEVINFKYKVDVPTPEFINGLSVWLQKRQTKTNFEPSIYIDNKKREIISLQHGTRRFYVQGYFRDNIKREKLIIDAGDMCWNEYAENDLRSCEISIPKDIELAFLAIIAFYKNKNLLPSTTFLNDEIKKLYSDFTDKLVEYLRPLSRESLSDEVKSLSMLGTLNIQYGEKLTLFTPLHPVNIAYQLVTNDILGNDEIPLGIAERLGATNIIPYLKKSKDTLYAPIGQSHSPEWIYYSNTGLGSQTIAKRFVPLLIKEKIGEFVRHFSHLFLDSRRPIKINLINMGNCAEALSGIFQYYQERLLDKNVSAEDIPPMYVHIFSSHELVTKFEELSQHTDPDLIEQEFGINLHRSKDFEPEVWLELFHRKVHFYSSRITGDNYEYAHISFFQFDSTKAHVSNYDIDKIPSGLSLGGLISDVPSINENNNYRSCFGFKGESFEHNELTSVARLFNPLVHVAGTNDLYDYQQTTATVINSNVRTELEGIYQASQWVTFIDPKVDLSFFKESKDVVIIHYSDQYNNASGYDAITVTKKCRQYQQALSLLFTQNSMTVAIEDINKVIDIFNAINGDWLLKLNSQKSRGSFKEEKISILAAAKAGLGIFDVPSITWIPISLEEILRVSGCTGLKKTDGLFSSKTLGESGETCDDILFIGIEAQNEKIKMHLFPIEVKIGDNNSNTGDKAKKQALHTAGMLRKYLTGDSFTAKIYRNFFAKLALVNAGKLSLYEIWPEYKNRWDKIKDYQYKLLNDDFALDWSLENYIGKAGFISFKASTDYGSRSIIENSEKVYHVELLASDSTAFLIKPTNNIQMILHQGLSHLLKDVYNHDNPFISCQAENKNPEAHVNSASPTISSSEMAEPLSVELESLKVLFGHHANNGSPIYWYPTDTDKVMHPNTGIIGTMGTGKTQFTKSLVAQIAWNSQHNVGGKKIGILIFDYKGDYIKDDFVNATQAQVYNLHHLPYNPLAIIKGNAPPPMLPLHTANSIRESIAKAFDLGIKQKQKLRDCIMDAYNANGIDKSNNATWDSPAPTISDVCEIYLNDPDVKEDSLYAAISNLHEFEIFEPDTSKTKSLYDLIDGVTVINLSGYDNSIQNLVVAITLDLFYTQMQRTGHSIIDGQYRQLTKFILVDEADNFLSKNFESIKKIMKEGREFGVGTILSTQFLNHFSTGENEYSNYIFTWIVHRVNEIRTKEADALFSLNDSENKNDLIAQIKNLEKHYSIVNQSGNRPTLMKDCPFWKVINHKERC